MTEAPSHARSAPRRPRVAHRTVPSFGMAVAMHALLFIGMSIAVRWKTDSEAAAVAEVWGPLPPVMEVAPPPPPPVEVKPEPKPEPPPPKEPDIVEKQEKKAPPKKEEKKPDIDKKKIEEQRRQKELEQRRELETQREAIRKEEAARLERQLGATASNTPVSGRGTDAGWNAQVIACIRPHIAFAVPENTSPDVHAEFRMEVLPTGEQVAVRLTRPSNLPGFDSAAERAIRRCDPIPRQKDGTVPRSFVLVVRPVEMR